MTSGKHVSTILLNKPYTLTTKCIIVILSNSFIHKLSIIVRSTGFCTNSCSFSFYRKLNPTQE
jgi:hypothetical protein